MLILISIFLSSMIYGAANSSTWNDFLSKSIFIRCHCLKGNSLLYKDQWICLTIIQFYEVNGNWFWRDCSEIVLHVVYGVVHKCAHKFADWKKKHSNGAWHHNIMFRARNIFQWSPSSGEEMNCWVNYFASVNSWTVTISEIRGLKPKDGKGLK